MQEASGMGPRRARSALSLWDLGTTPTYPAQPLPTTPAGSRGSNRLQRERPQAGAQSRVQNATARPPPAATPPSPPIRVPPYTTPAQVLPTKDQQEGLKAFAENWPAPKRMPQQGCKTLPPAPEPSPAPLHPPGAGAAHQGQAGGAQGICREAASAVHWGVTARALAAAGSFWQQQAWFGSSRLSQSGSGSGRGGRGWGT